MLRGLCFVGLAAQAIFGRNVIFTPKVKNPVEHAAEVQRARASSHRCRTTGENVNRVATTKLPCILGTARAFTIDIAILRAP